jgi:glutathione-specific gamma-glutamylcyclotransferase
MQDDLWVFGYGSLIWDPAFPVAERMTARLDGWRRSFCMASIHYRGTAESPGRVLALDRAEGAECHGVAMRADPAGREAARAALHKRELISDAYIEEWVTLDLADGRRVRAVTYVINHEQGQYCGHEDIETAAQVIARASGVRGPNRDYLFATVSHLEELGIPDAALAALAARVREIG